MRTSWPTACLERSDLLASLKEGYSDEYKCTCLGLSLAVVLFSPNLAELLGALLPQSDTTVSIVASYAALLALAYVAGITVDGIVPYSVKDWLLYPAIGERGSKRPGCCIFSDIASGKAKDFRFEISSARELYKDQITVVAEKGAAESAQYQNAEWYKLYARHCKSSSVQSNHLGHLYSRDVFTLSVAVLALGVICDAICVLVGIPIPVSAASMGCVAVIAAASWISARWKAKRLVLTVIARDIAESGDDTHEHD